MITISTLLGFATGPLVAPLFAPAVRLALQGVLWYLRGIDRTAPPPGPIARPPTGQPMSGNDLG